MQLAEKDESLSQDGALHRALGDSEASVVEVMAFDLGNRYVKAAIEGRLVKYPSYQKRRPLGQDLAVENLPADSWIIQMGAVEYLVGTIANQMQGLPSYQLNKWELAKQLFYGAIAALEMSGDIITIQTLRASTPDTQDMNQASRLKSLEGVHEFSINGQATTVTVERVVLFDEGVPAWLNAFNQGLWQFPAANNGILDLGGGTAIARLITPQGTVVRGSEIVMTGTSELAEIIQSDIRVTRQGNIILDAIETGSFTLLNV